MNTFDLQCNDGIWELTNRSSAEAKNVRFQLHVIVPDGDKGTTRPTDIRIEEIESLMPKQSATLRFDDQFTPVAMSGMEVGINGLRQYKEGDRGYSQQVFFEHSAETFRITSLMSIRPK